MDARLKSSLETQIGLDRVLATGAVQVLCSESDATQWRLGVDCAGVVLHVSEGAGENGAWLSVFRLENGVRWPFEFRLEIYPELEAVAVSSLLVAIEVDDGTLGLNFADSAEAHSVVSNIRGLQLLKSRSPRVSPRSSPRASEAESTPPPLPSHTKRSPRPAPPAVPGRGSQRKKPPPVPSSVASSSTEPVLSPTVSPRSTAALPPKSPTLARSSSAALSASTLKLKNLSKSFFKNLKKPSNSADSNVPEDFEISAPSDFDHRSHVGWDAQNGFDVQNLPPEWKSLFRSAGLKKSDLKDEETALFVIGHIAEQLHDPALSSSRNSPPPPVPSVSSRRGTLSSGAHRPAPPLPPSVLVPADEAPIAPSTRSQNPVISSVPAIPSRQTPEASSMPPSSPLPSLASNQSIATSQTNAEPSPMPPSSPLPSLHANQSVAPVPPNLSSAPVAPPPPAATSGGGSPRPGPASLADQLGTVRLKKANVNDLQNLPQLNAAQVDGLAGSLAMALANRRGAIAPNQSADNDADGDSDDEWSD